MEEVFREYVREVGLSRNRGKFNLFIYDALRRRPFENDPLILLDGMQVHDIDKLMALSPLKLKKMEIVPYRYFLGKEVYYGILNITSATGDLAGYEPDAADKAFGYEQLQPVRKLNLPAYTTAEQKRSRLPDFRSLLYWNPALKIEANGKTELEFYASDVKGDFILEIRGHTSSGKSGQISTLIHVD